MSNGTSNGKTESGRQPENDYGMPLQQIIAMGEHASQLLQSPVYNLAHRMSLDSVIQEWSACQPKEREKRESLWHELQALGRTAQTLAGMVERAQQAAHAQSESATQAENEYLDQQGFGLNEVRGGHYN